MRRERLRPAYTDEQLHEVYPRPHDHRQWRIHEVRVQQTIAVGQWFTGVQSVADLSCGNGAIIEELGEGRTRYRGDFAPGYEYHGPIEETLAAIPDVDLFILSETLEHLDDPDRVLVDIRAKSQFLVLSTPANEWDDGNPEHYWGWDVEAVEAMLERAGWVPKVHTFLRFPGVYDWQIWACV